MLQLKDITKVYTIGKPKDKNYQTTKALKGVSIKFRKSEFVSILGPSGCGKTTMLNIIGGLDKYTSGDLVIDNVSTKQYKDKDWDNYRNNSVGFVFQSYNLIPHQTVLENVELALTLSGVKPAERKEKAKRALEKVGLKDKINSKPNQLSGGQMQRVAIARALVNDPEIILADEPTGALDTKTSVAVMELLKEVASDRLVIMVTHNPELAEQYSTRIIKMLDGVMVGDSNPITKEEQQAEDEKAKQAQEQIKTEEHKVSMLSKKEQKAYLKQKQKGLKKHKKRMGFLTALSLSFKNLLTKKARTLLVSFAGSIGIIGIALILSLSSGFQSYIDKVQKDTLSTYPITINRVSTDYTKLLESMMKETDSASVDSSKVYSNNTLSQMFGIITSGTSTNDLVSFKKYLQTADVSAKLKDVATIKYTYDLDLNIFYNSSKYISDDKSLLVSPFSMMSSMNGNSAFSIMSDVFEEMIDNPKLLTNQYDLVSGKWAENKVYKIDGKAYTDVMVVVDKNNAIADYALMAMGLRDRKDIDQLMDSSINTENLGKDFSIKLQDLIGMEYSLVLNPNMYKYNPETQVYNSILTNQNNNPVSKDYYNIDTANKDYVLENTEVTLKVVGVIKPNKDAQATALTGAVCYTNSLTNHVINRLNEYAKDETVEHNIIIDQNSQINSNRSVISGKAFSLTSYDIATKFTAESPDYNIDNHPTLTSQQKQIIKDFSSASIDIMSKAQSLVTAFEKQVPQGKTVLDVAGEIFKQYMFKPDELASLSANKQLAFRNFSDAYKVYQSADQKVMDEFSADLLDGSTKQKTLQKIGEANLESPSSISFYAVDFEAKDKIESVIKQYNDMVLKDPSKGEDYAISYTDYVGLMMSSISVIINAITYVLIAFVSISLIVSSIMIGIITYISVLERTKEIGVLRSVGASKRDIKRVFTAESLIIGFVAGMLGIIITLILIIPVNIIIEHLAGIAHVASLPWVGGLVLVLISMFLTFIAGLIPANIASKKDPVIALRTE